MLECQFLFSNLSDPLKWRMGFGDEGGDIYFDIRSFAIAVSDLPYLSYQIDNAPNIFLCFRRQSDHEI